MVSQGGVGPAGSRWSLSSQTFRLERYSWCSPGGAVRPRLCHLAFVGHGMGFRRGPKRAVPGHCLGRSCFRWRREGTGWSGRGEAGAEPSRRRGRASPVPAGSGKGGFCRWGQREILGVTETRLRRRRPLISRPLSQLLPVVTSFPAIVTFHGLRSPNTQVPSYYLTRNGSRKPRP